MINLQYSVAFISSRCALQRLRRSIRFPSIFGFLLMIFCRKTQRTNAKSGRPKVADWKVAMWKKITGRLVSKWERTGRNWSNFAHRHTDTHVNLSSIDIDILVLFLCIMYLWRMRAFVLACMRERMCGMFAWVCDRVCVHDIVHFRCVQLIVCRVTWGKAPPFGDDLSLTYLFASTSEKSYMYVTNYMLCV